MQEKFYKYFIICIFIHIVHEADRKWAAIFRQNNNKSLAILAKWG